MDKDITLDQEGQDILSDISTVNPPGAGNQIAADLRFIPKGKVTSSAGILAQQQLPGVATIPSGEQESALRNNFNKKRNFIFGTRQTSTAAAQFNYSTTSQVIR